MRAIERARHCCALVEALDLIARVCWLQNILKLQLLIMKSKKSFTRANLNVFKRRVEYLVIVGQTVEFKREKIEINAMIRVKRVRVSVRVCSTSLKIASAHHTRVNICMKK